MKKPRYCRKNCTHKVITRTRSKHMLISEHIFCKKYDAQLNAVPGTDKVIKLNKCKK